jgi:hypothetical protein
LTCSEPIGTRRAPAASTVDHLGGHEVAPPPLARQSMPLRRVTSAYQRALSFGVRSSVS